MYITYEWQSGAMVTMSVTTRRQLEPGSEQKIFRRVIYKDNDVMCTIYVTIWVSKL
jgi:hypothetical protein